MGRSVARHTLKGARNVDEPLELFVAVVNVLQGLRELERLVKRHVERHRHLLGNGIRVGIADVQRPADVAYRHSRGHRAEGDYLRDVIAAVETVDVVYDLAAAVNAEVNVDIGHGNALGV